MCPWTCNQDRRSHVHIKSRQSKRAEGGGGRDCTAPSFLPLQTPCRGWNNKHLVQLCLLLPNRGGSTNVCLQEAGHELCASAPSAPSSYWHAAVRFQLWNCWLCTTITWSHTTPWERPYAASACKQPRRQKEKTHTLATPNKNRIKEKKIRREQGWNRKQAATKVHCTRKSTEKHLSGINLLCSLP